MSNGAPQTARVSQAQGMVSAQAGCSIRDALALMTQRADDSDVTIDDVADAVLARTMRFGE